MFIFGTGLIRPVDPEVRSLLERVERVERVVAELIGVEVRLYLSPESIAFALEHVDD